MSELADRLDRHPLWRRAVDLADNWTRDDKITALGFTAGTSSEQAGPVFRGRRSLDCPSDDPASLPEDTLFLVASITKPILAMGVMTLVERGELLLGTKVSDIIPEFGRSGTYGITLHHLLTHSSGLPDMLPENRELRQQHASLDAFVEGTCRVELSFPAGRQSSYSSMGFALLGAVIERTTGMSPRAFLQREFFEPLGMTDTSLGAPVEWFEGEAPVADRIAEIRIPERFEMGDDWNWNSRYWRSLGAPWGGLVTSPGDLAVFARMMLSGGVHGTGHILSPATVRVATINQLEAMKDIPEVTRRCRAWGLGWRLHWPAHSANFGDLLSPSSYGHWGATGTVLWIDPQSELWAVILTTEPQEPQGTRLARLSNLLAAALSEACDEIR
jgi:CubicO group peptidase (beta-lactamase class C family)